MELEVCQFFIIYFDYTPNITKSLYIYILLIIMEQLYMY